MIVYETQNQLDTKPPSIAGTPATSRVRHRGGLYVGIAATALVLLVALAALLVGLLAGPTGEEPVLVGREEVAARTSWDQREPRGEEPPAARRAAAVPSSPDPASEPAEPYATRGDDPTIPGDATGRFQREEAARSATSNRPWAILVGRMPRVVPDWDAFERERRSTPQMVRLVDVLLRTAILGESPVVSHVTDHLHPEATAGMAFAEAVAAAVVRGQRMETDAVLRGLDVLADYPGTVGGSGVVHLLTMRDPDIVRGAWAYLSRRTAPPDASNRNVVANAARAALDGSAEQWPLDAIRRHPNANAYGHVRRKFEETAGRLLDTSSWPNQRETASLAVLITWLSGLALNPEGVRDHREDPVISLRRAQGSTRSTIRLGLSRSTVGIEAPRPSGAMRERKRELVEALRTDGAQLARPIGWQPPRYVGDVGLFADTRYAMAGTVDWLALQRAGLAAVPAIIDRLAEIPLTNTEHRRPSGRIDATAIDDIEFLCNIPLFEIGPEIERIGLSALPSKWRGSDAALRSRLAEVRALCLRWFREMGRLPATDPAAAGREFLAAMLREARSDGLHGAIGDRERIELLRTVMMFDDPRLIPDVLALPRRDHDIVFGQTMSSLTRHTFNSDEHDADATKWYDWIDRHVPKKVVPAGG